jgi:hypothetical protein
MVLNGVQGDRKVTKTDVTDTSTTINNSFSHATGSNYQGAWQDAHSGGDMLKQLGDRTRNMTPDQRDAEFAKFSMAYAQEFGGFVSTSKGTQNNLQQSDAFTMKAGANAGFDLFGIGGKVGAEASSDVRKVLNSSESQTVNAMAASVYNNLKSIEGNKDISPNQWGNEMQNLVGDRSKKMFNDVTTSKSTADSVQETVGNLREVAENTKNKILGVTGGNPGQAPSYGGNNNISIAGEPPLGSRPNRSASGEGKPMNTAPEVNSEKPVKASTEKEGAVDKGKPAPVADIAPDVNKRDTKEDKK